MQAVLQKDELKTLSEEYLAEPLSDTEYEEAKAQAKRKLARIIEREGDNADRLPRDGSVTLLDTRTVEEFAHGHIDGFYNIPVDELRERLGELDKRKLVYVICQSGLRSYIACRILAGNGFDCYNFSGGFRFYDAVTNDRCLIESATACGMDRA